MNSSRAGLVIVVPVTSTRRPIPSHVEIESGGSGLDHVSYAKVEDIKSVSVERLVRRFGSVDPPVPRHITEIVRLLLDM